MRACVNVIVDMGARRIVHIHSKLIDGIVESMYLCARRRSPLTYRYVCTMERLKIEQLLLHTNNVCERVCVCVV